ncbi:MAG: aminoacyl-histidine dipeptidase [Vallitaleaceae bacterium]|jgi:dipeptidase D|nr:aminoacyl-histidine dipeptidase [Vallitaleaceae bacterium]
MGHIFTDYRPEKVWQYFEAITKIPRRSGNEAGMSDYLLAFAKDRGLVAYRDEYFNTVIKKQATKGYEKSNTVIIQGHLDMVCEKNSDIIFDFEKDALNLKIVDGWLTAEGTTLGADNGIAIAFALALLDSDDVAHPALEIVMTTDEEVGMTGALNMDTSSLKGKTFLNIDSEEEGELVVSCAGGLKAYIEYPVESDDLLTEGRILMEVVVKGLLGGHSGVEIDQNRGNAIKILGRVLNDINNAVDMNIVDIYGGMKDNVIPREASAFVLIPAFDEDLFAGVIEKTRLEVSNEYLHTDPNITIVYEDIECESSINAIPRDQTDTAIFLLNALPNGILAMSQNIPDLVETSLNLGVVKLKDGFIKYVFATRSSIDSKKAQMTKMLELIAKQTGSDFEVTSEYPGWDVRTESPLLEKSIAVYKTLYGKEPLVKGIHAGLESGVFLKKLKDADAISFGPDMESVHSPDERLSMASTERVWDYLVALLKSL